MTNNCRKKELKKSERHKTDYIVICALDLGYNVNNAIITDDYLFLFPLAGLAEISSSSNRSCFKIFLKQIGFGELA